MTDTPKTKAYAGIGSRETPPAVLRLMRRLGVVAARQGYLLRSGAAPGADTAFEQGCDAMVGPKEIYVPWEGFQNRFSNQRGVIVPQMTSYLLDLAAQYHPAWQHCSQAAQKLHARNCHQILGPDLRSPVEEVFCWTRNGSGGGGTGQALRLARAYEIPIYDLGNPETFDQVQAALWDTSSPRLPQTT